MSRQPELGGFHKLGQTKNSTGAGVLKTHRCPSCACCRHGSSTRFCQTLQGTHPEPPPRLEAVDVHQFAEDKTQNSLSSQPAFLRVLQLRSGTTKCTFQLGCNFLRTLNIYCLITFSILHVSGVTLAPGRVLHGGHTKLRL